MILLKCDNLGTVSLNYDYFFSSDFTTELNYTVNGMC